MAHSLLRVNKFKSKYTGVIYYNGGITEHFRNQEELLDFRVQIMENQIEGFTCIFDFDEDKKHCELLLDGSIENHPEHECPRLDLSIKIRTHQLKKENNE